MNNLERRTPFAAERGVEVKSDGPCVDDQGVGLFVQKHAVQDVLRQDRDDAGDQSRFAVPIKGLQSETTRIDLSALLHEALKVLVEVQMARERFIPELGETSLDPQCDARPVKKDRSLIAFPLQADGIENVHKPDGAFERHRVEGYERLLTRVGLNVLENLGLVVDKEVTILVRRLRYFRHVCISSCWVDAETIRRKLYESIVSSLCIQ
ncbi:hypothetical protein AGR1B_pAt30105 [Agrobacterium fabacearum S56]|nr:hypothetical protein AGR1B_pAt30105 [Agrobacterium fabacearum S56]